MDYFLILSHTCQEQQNQSKPLATLTIELVDPHQSIDIPADTRTFNGLTEDAYFRTAIQSILNLIHKITLEFNNVQLVADNA